MNAPTFMTSVSKKFLCVLRPLRCVQRIWLSVFHLLPVRVQRPFAQHPWATGITVVVLIFLVIGYRALTAEPAPEILTATVTRGNLTQVVEAVGELTSERDLNLQFPISGVMAEVLVKEGDTVKAGQKLAALRARDLAANVQSALASVQSAQAELQAMQEGTRPEDIAIAEAEVANKRASLDAARNKLTASEQKLAALKQEADTALSGYLSTAKSTVSQRVTSADTSMSVAVDVLDDADVNIVFQLQGNRSAELLAAQVDSVKSRLRPLLLDAAPFADYQEALMALQQARAAIQSASAVLESLYAAVSTLPSTSSFTQSEREARKTDINTERGNIQTAASAVETQLKSLQDAAANYNTLIASEETTVTVVRGDILTLETSLRTQEAQLALKRAGVRQTDIDGAAARVRRAQADLERARSAYQDTILSAPVAGFITKVNVKTGELLSTAFQQEAAITMLGDSPYRIELYSSEVDITKVKLQQNATVELDAFSGVLFPLTVAEIDPAATNVDGVPKYRIKLDFTETDPGFKIGMTGDVRIVTGERNNVLMVPARAVIENADGKNIVRVSVNGQVEERSVETGMEGENDIEIISGVTEGEEVIVLIKK